MQEKKVTRLILILQADDSSYKHTASSSDSYCSKNFIVVIDKDYNKLTLFITALDITLLQLRKTCLGRPL